MSEKSAVHIEKVEIHYHNNIDMTEVISILNIIKLQNRTMGQKTDQAIADLATIKDSLTKIGTETSTLLQKVTDLENAAANADTPQSVLDAIAEVKTAATAVDDLVPDATQPPAEGGEGSSEPQG